MTPLDPKPLGPRSGVTVDVPTVELAPLRPADPATGQEPSDRHGGFRGDVAGLRAVAVGVVLLYHAGLAVMPGGFVGVDVFFVISGFLITGQMLAEINRSGRVSLVAFYARRAKRILPAASVVLVATAVAAWLWVPATRWLDAGGDIVSAGLYVANWRLADRSVDYLAQDSGAVSPVQHYWSLAVEEQFYLVWPLLIVVALLVVRALRGRGSRPILAAGLLLVAVPSFAWSIFYTQHDPAKAFFVSTTRMWELAIGAGVALGAAQLSRIPKPVAVVMGWLGLACVIAAATIYSAKTAWPGYAALLPTLGAAAVIAAGVSAERLGPVALLGTRPMRWIGDLSYSLYLWHWPMLVVAAAYAGPLSWKKGLLVAALSIIPAWITYRIVENPLRYSKAISRSPRLALALGGNFTLVGTAAGLALLAAVSLSATTSPVSRVAAGAGALPNPYGALDPIPEKADYLIPSPEVALYDSPDSAAECFLKAGTTPIWCTFGKPDGATRIALVGDSKMEQWLPAFEDLAEVNDWRLDVSFKAACSFSTAYAVIDNDPAKRYPDCDAWNRIVVDQIIAGHPDYVITSQSSSLGVDPATGVASVDALYAGMRATWSRLESAGIKVIAVANNSSPGLDVDKCVLQNMSHLSTCSFDRRRHDNDPGFAGLTRAVEAHPTVPMIDLFPQICPTNLTPRCPAVIGNVIVYRSGSHLTATFVRTLAPWLAAELTDAGLPARIG